MLAGLGRFVQRDGNGELSNGLVLLVGQGNRDGVVFAICVREEWKSRLSDLRLSQEPIVNDAARASKGQRLEDKKGVGTVPKLGGQGSGAITGFCL